MIIPTIWENKIHGNQTTNQIKITCVFCGSGWNAQVIRSVFSSHLPKGLAGGTWDAASNSMGDHLHSPRAPQLVMGTEWKYEIIYIYNYTMNYE